MISLLKRLWIHLSVLRKKQFGLLLMLTLITAFTEIISLGALIPFLTALTNPELVFQNQYLSKFLIFLEITAVEEVILPLALVLC